MFKALFQRLFGKPTQNTTPELPFTVHIGKYEVVYRSKATGRIISANSVRSYIESM